MVAYKKLSNTVRDDISNKMELIRRNKELTDRIKVLSKKIEDTLWDEIPNEVKEFYKKFPQYTNVDSRSLYALSFFDDDEQNYYEYRFNIDVVFNLSKVLNNYFYKQHYLCLGNDNQIVKYIKKNYPDLYNEAREIIFDAIKIRIWKKNVRCILQSITTLNKLKDEFPEAYEIYESMYTSNNENKKDNDTSKPNMCDTIENVRAEFNKSLN